MAASQAPTEASEEQYLLEDKSNSAETKPEYDESIFQEVPVYITCPYCHEKIVSKTHLKSGRWTYWTTACLCIFQCYCCFWVPFLLDGLKNVVHECPKCEKQLAEYRSCRLFQRKRPKRMRRASLLF